MGRAPVVGKPYLLREINEQAVLDVLRKRGPLSRTALTSHLALSKSTVSAVVGGLIAHNLITETPAQTPRIGRRPRLLEINPDAGYVLGADLGATTVRMAAADLSGEIRATAQEPTTHAGLGDLLAQLAGMVRRITAEVGIPRGKVLTFALGVPGAVGNGAIRLCPNLPFLEGVHFRGHLTRRVRIPVIMDNDVNFAAVGEKWRGCAAGVRNFAYVAVGTGVGMGLILGDELYRGTRGYAGEIGYLPIHRNGGTVAVERLIGGPGIARAARVRAPRGQAPRASPEAVFADARRGDPKALALVDEVAAILAWTIACVNVTADLDLVVLGGGVGGNADLLLPRVRAKLTTMAPFAPHLAPSALQGRAALFGAVAVALRAGRASARRVRAGRAPAGGRTR